MSLTVAATFVNILKCKIHFCINFIYMERDKHCGTLKSTVKPTVSICKNEKQSIYPTKKLI